MRYFKKSLQYLISYPVYFFLYIISPFLRIRFGRIYANRVGHLCFNTDNYLSSIKNKKNVFTFFCYDEPISNEYLFRLFNKNTNIFFSNKVRFLYYIFQNINKNSKLLVSNQNELHPKISFISSQERNLPPINNYDLLNEFLKKNNINDKFVCINNRDNQYLKEINSQDKNNHNFRNFKISSFNKTIKYLVDQGFFVIRVGKISENPIQYESKKVIDLTNKNYNEQLQILLF